MIYIVPDEENHRMVASSIFYHFMYNVAPLNLREKVILYIS